MPDKKLDPKRARRFVWTDEDIEILDKEEVSEKDNFSVVKAKDLKKD